MYWRSISFTSRSLSSMMPAFCAGISRSSTQIERPARVAKPKPVYMSLSAKITVSRMPQRRNASLMSFEISFFLSGLLMSANDRPAGRISDMRERPTVVS